MSQEKKFTFRRMENVELAFAVALRYAMERENNDDRQQTMCTAYFPPFTTLRSFPSLSLCRPNTYGIFTKHFSKILQICTVELAVFHCTQIILSVWEKFPDYSAHIRARIMNLAKSHERKALQFIEHI